MTTTTRHLLTVTYTVIVPEEVLTYLKESNGTLYWVEDEYAVVHDDNDDIVIQNNEHTFVYDNATALKGIQQWLENGGDWEELRDLETDHYDHDQIWQYGFFGELVFA
jgi:hypothetical protein